MISNLSLNIAITVRDETTEDERNARVKVPNSLPRFLPRARGNGVCWRISSSRTWIACSQE